MKIKPIKVSFQDEKLSEKVDVSDPEKKSPEKTLTTVNIYDHDIRSLPVVDLEDHAEQQRLHDDRFFTRYTLLSLVIIICIGVIGSLFVALGFILCNMYEDVGGDSDTVYFVNDS